MALNLNSSLFSLTDKPPFYILHHYYSYRARETSDQIKGKEANKESSLAGLGIQTPDHDGEHHSKCVTVQLDIGSQGLPEVASNHMRMVVFYSRAVCLDSFHSECLERPATEVPRSFCLSSCHPQLGLWRSHHGIIYHSQFLTVLPSQQHRCILGAPPYPVWLFHEPHQQMVKSRTYKVKENEIQLASLGVSNYNWILVTFIMGNMASSSLGQDYEILNLFYRQLLSVCTLLCLTTGVFLFSRQCTSRHPLCSMLTSVF